MVWLLVTFWQVVTYAKQAAVYFGRYGGSEIMMPRKNSGCFTQQGGLHMLTGTS